MPMFNTIFRKGSMPVLEKAMAFHEQRHKYIAQNIANVETPFYKARDLDSDRFTRLLKFNLRERDKKPVKTMDFKGDGAHWEDAYGAFQVASRKLSGDSVLRHDENNVSIEKEMAKLSKNAGAFKGRVSLYQKHVQLMRDVIRSR